MKWCLDNAIASAVTEYGRDKVELTEAHTVNATLTLAERQLYLINMAIVAMDAIKSGNVGITGATGGVLTRSLRFLQDLTVRALADDRAGTDIPGPTFKKVASGGTGQGNTGPSL